MLFQDITNGFTSLLYACVPWSEKKEKKTYICKSHLHVELQVFILHLIGLFGPTVNNFLLHGVSFCQSNFQTFKASRIGIPMIPLQTAVAILEGQPI